MSFPTGHVILTTERVGGVAADDSHSHKKSECPNPKAFNGECRHCKKEGHMSKECPDAPPPRCGNCRKEGHYIDECPEPLVCPRCQGSHRVRDCTEPMKCRHCEGDHMAKECPVYVPTCNNCGETSKFKVSVQSPLPPFPCLTDRLSPTRPHRFRV